MRSTEEIVFYHASLASLRNHIIILYRYSVVKQLRQHRARLASICVSLSFGSVCKYIIPLLLLYICHTATYLHAGLCVKRTYRNYCTKLYRRRIFTVIGRKYIVNRDVCGAYSHNNLYLYIIYIYIYTDEIGCMVARCVLLFCKRQCPHNIL